MEAERDDGDFDSGSSRSGSPVHPFSFQGDVPSAPTGGVSPSFRFHRSSRQGSIVSSDHTLKGALDQISIPCLALPFDETPQPPPPPLVPSFRRFKQQQQ